MNIDIITLVKELKKRNIALGPLASPMKLLRNGERGIVHKSRSSGGYSYCKTTPKAATCVLLKLEDIPLDKFCTTCSVSSLADANAETWRSALLAVLEVHRVCEDIASNAKNLHVGKVVAILISNTIDLSYRLKEHSFDKELHEEIEKTLSLASSCLAAAKRSSDKAAEFKKISQYCAALKVKSNYMTNYGSLTPHAKEVLFGKATSKVSSDSPSGIMLCKEVFLERDKFDHIGHLLSAWFELKSSFQSLSLEELVKEVMTYHSNVGKNIFSNVSLKQLPEKSSLPAKNYSSFKEWAYAEWYNSYSKLVNCFIKKLEDELSKTMQLHLTAPDVLLCISDWPSLVDRAAENPSSLDTYDLATALLSFDFVKHPRDEDIAALKAPEYVLEAICSDTTDYVFRSITSFGEITPSDKPEIAELALSFTEKYDETDKFETYLKMAREVLK